MTDQYAVFGNPIAHSKSPLIHTAFAKQTQQDLIYDKELIALEDFVSRADAFFDSDGKGLNITVPFKLEAYEYAQLLSQRARQAGAVNTLAKQDNGQIIGDNTDGIGLLFDIVNNLSWQVNGARVLVLGAGGAVRGVLGPMLDESPAEIIIANRTEKTAMQLARAFGTGAKVKGLGFAAVEGSFDLVINGTSASLAGDLPPLNASIIGANTACYDMMYAPQDTVFMQWARENGCSKVADGLGMLVEQAAHAFELWRGVKPQTTSVIEAIRNNVL
jgi:shikimate dehydrogenase